MELVVILWLVRRWLWLLILGAVVVGGLNYIQGRLTPVQYEASTILQIGTALQDLKPEFNFNMLSAQLAQDYSATLKTLPILEDVRENLKLTISPEQLSQTFTATIMESTTFLVIRVRYTDPITAADIANELAAQLIAISPTDVSANLSENLANLISENEKVKTQLRTLRETLAEVKRQLGGTLTPEQRQELEARREQLELNVAKTENNLATFSTLIVGMGQRTRSNVIEVQTPAQIPSVPLPDRGLYHLFSGAVVGLVVAGSLAYVYEYVTDTVREPIEVTAQMNASVLASVPPFGKKGTYKGKLVAWYEPHSPYAEAYRVLRTNLLNKRSTGGQPDQRSVYVVTSPSPSEGKSVTAANLAVTLANAGLRVLLVDADLRRPNQHHIFGVPNQTGLTELLNDTSLWRTITNAVPLALNEQDASLQLAFGEQIKAFASTVTVKTLVPRLDLITAGSLPPNPVELLGSAQVQTLAELFTAVDQHDVLIFDTAPVMHVVDSVVLANITQAGVIIVIEAGKTHYFAATNVLRQFDELHIPIVGIVLNRLKPRSVTNYAVYTDHLMDDLED